MFLIHHSGIRALLPSLTAVNLTEPWRYRQGKGMCLYVNPMEVLVRLSRVIGVFPTSLWWCTYRPYSEVCDHLWALLADAVVYEYYGESVHQRDTRTPARVY